jgi:hypothetical protein
VKSARDSAGSSRCEGQAVGHRDQEHQHLAQEGEVGGAGIDVELRAAHAQQHLLRHAPDDEGHHAGLLGRALGCIALEPAALDAHRRQWTGHQYPPLPSGCGRPATLAPCLAGPVGNRSYRRLLSQPGSTLAQALEHVAEVRRLAVLAELVAQVVDDGPVVVGQGQPFGGGNDGHHVVAEVGFEQVPLFIGL